MWPLLLLLVFLVTAWPSPIECRRLDPTHHHYHHHAPHKHNVSFPNLVDLVSDDLINAWPADVSGRGTGSRQAQKPLLGWNSYNHFPEGVDEKLVRETADALVSLGLSSLGYKYMNIDDGWQAKDRTFEGHLVPNPMKFPNGMKATSDYLHTKGLKLGIYSDAGHRTCMEFPGSLGHEVEDARTFASWGIDYLKYDNCFHDNTPTKERYQRMRDALDQVERDIHFNMCEWGEENPATWARTIGDSWRTTLDIKDEWTRMLKHALLNDRWAKFAGPGGWNDLDALEVGNGAMTVKEYRVQFTLWAIMKSPLVLGNDVRKMDEGALSIVGNKEVIDINQDSLGIQARVVYNDTNCYVWAGPLSDNRLVVAIVNTDPDTIHSMTLTQRMLKLNSQSAFSVRDVWEDESEDGVQVGSITKDVFPHNVKLLVLTPSTQ